MDKERARCLPARMLPKLSEKQRKTVDRYATKTKLQAVMRWRQRLAKGGIAVAELAEAVGKPASRLSEYLNLKVEPSEDSFHAIESALYGFGV